MPGNNNNSVGTTNNMPEPSLADVINLIGNIPNKSDFADLQNKLLVMTEDNKNKIAAVEQQVDNVSSTVTHNSDKIASLEYTIETLQQKNLRNNVCISGAPVEAETDISDVVTRIAGALQVTLRAIDFSAYTISNNKFIIVIFNNYTHKQQLLNKIRMKKSLMVEEVFGATQSNSQIYINEHLTKFFNQLYLMARTAVKQGKLASARSSGGQIRVRKQEDSTPVIVTGENHLQSIIDSNSNQNNTTPSHPPHEHASSKPPRQPSKHSRNATEFIRPHKRKNNRSPTTGQQPSKHQRKGDSGTNCNKQTRSQKNSDH